MKSSLRIFPYLSLAVFLLPVVVGLLGTWLPAFGYLPVVGAENFSLQPFRDFFSHPSLTSALRGTIISGCGAPLLAGGLSLWLVITLYGTRLWNVLLRLLAPLLAIPHASFAIGFAFLVAPSGFILRIFSPELTGFLSPPDIATVKDPLALSLTFALALKEIPFLLLMTISALSQLDVKRTHWIGGSLGYGNFRIWTHLLLPQIYPQLRLPILAVLAYSLSVVDMAMILGPTAPPTLAVLLNRWFNDPDITMRLTGAAGASFLFLLVVAGVVLYLLMEKGIAGSLHRSRLTGKRASTADSLGWTGGILLGTISMFLFSAIAVLCIWSCTKSWRFPDFLPGSWSLAFWQKGVTQAYPSLLTAMGIGGVAVVLATVLVLGCLEYEVDIRDRFHQGRSQNLLWLLYLPLLVPQISFIFGVQMVAVFLHVEGYFLSLVAAHLIFVLPYVFLTLSRVYRGFDERYMQVAITLNGSRWRSFYRVKLPMLMKPIAFSMATGFAVSIVQYLPTLYIGAGRFSTITTETVSLATGSDRRIIAVYAILQFGLPFLVYGIALLLPLWWLRNREAMKH